jgi:dienelactone hydrolase
MFAPDAPERKLRSAALQKLREDANARDRAAWAKIVDRASWEGYRDEELALLRKSLGRFPGRPKTIEVMTTKTIMGDGFRVENLVYESRPGLVVTANLYVPARATKAMPGIVIIHSHHNPKTQGELQDMGMTWARAGCLVLVPDQLGHGERRQHPFADAKSYPTPFKVGRQDYYFRYNLGLQLQLIGDSLMGWMVHDLMCGIDVLLQRPGIDKGRIIVLGSVAGGGDPAAVLAALDPRVSAVVPFNFGGAQPETKYPLPPDAERTFNYMGGGSWESTRNLRLSACDGFLPWLIVAAAAPRPLIYAHEFAWDEEHDPVWRRFQKIYSFYDARDKLAAMHGRGSVSGKPPDATHCNNIGTVHRTDIHPLFKKWFGIDAVEYQKRLPAEELLCLTAAAKDRFKPRLAHQLINQEADHMAFLRRDGLRPVQTVLQKLLSWHQGIQVPRGPITETVTEGNGIKHRYRTLVIRHADEPRVAVPLLWLQPAKANGKTPVVVAVAQAGKAGFLKHRADVIVQLLYSGVAVCLPDLRGTGEMRPRDAGRGRTGSDTAYSATELMHGKTLLGRQVQELLLVMEALRDQGAGPIALWGDSFAPVNTPDAKLAVPYDADGPQPKLGEPMGGLVVLLTALYAPKDAVRAVHIHGCLVRYRSALASPFIHVPHDAFVPGMAAVTDVGEIAMAIGQPVGIEAAIDAQNRRAGPKELAADFASDRLTLRDAPATPDVLAAWFVAKLQQSKRGASR